MKQRPQVNIRLDQALLAEVDEIGEVEGVDRSEIVRRLLASGLAAYRMEVALRDYRRGRVSAWKAATIANVSLYEMLDRIQAEGIAYELDPEVLDRLDARFPAARVREPVATYASEPGDDATTGIATLRSEFRPAVVKWLFVGESSPAGGTHFYKANSNLFRATRAAFAAALGNERVPDGPRFLHWFREQGYWLVDLADRPVNRLGRGERDAEVVAGIDRLARLLEELQPEQVVVVKSSIGALVREAASAAGSRAHIIELPFPVRQWRAVYERRLSEAIRQEPVAQLRRLRDQSDAGRVATGTAGQMTLDEAIADALTARGNIALTAAEIADEIARRGTFRRPSDGMPPPPSQVQSRVSHKQYRDRFERVDRRIRLRQPV
jgi:hypothetical protein